MSKKYVIDLPDDAQYILINGASENHCYTRVEQVDDLEELNSDYINEHYGELQDEAYQKGFEDGKKYLANGCVGCQYEGDESRVNPCCECARVCNDHYIPKHSDRIEVGDKVIVPSNSHIKPGELLSIVNGVCYIMWEDKTVSGYEISGVRRCTE